jgi:peptidoglycan/xylan/chitin deacetylase (PgdA/CDA1 family)
MALMAATSVARWARRAAHAVVNPAVIVRRLIGDANRIQPAVQATSDPLAPFQNLIALGRKTGLSRPTLFLSFDCDTDLDFTAALEVKRFLDSLGIKATWAVPGVQIERGEATYRAIAAAGDEFMNHGQLPHTAWEGDRYVSITWYHEMTPEAVVADITAGDATIRRVLGVAPTGFRAPHFGLYSEPAQLNLVRESVRRLGYSYCSTTLPDYGLAHGPIVPHDELIELPTFGSTGAPTCVLDSWTYLTDRRDYKLGETYADLMCETVDRFVAAQAPVLFTWYADPSHVAGQAPFERAMRHLVKQGVGSVFGREAARLVSSVTAAV